MSLLSSPALLLEEKGARILVSSPWGEGQGEGTEYSFAGVIAYVEGRWLPTAEEQAEQERDRAKQEARKAEQEHQRAEQEAQKPSFRISTQEEFLKDALFEIKQGDRVEIGRNGAGKSTLLKVLSRITEPTQARISIEGKVASSWKWERDFI